MTDPHNVSFIRPEAKLVLDALESAHPPRKRRFERRRGTWVEITQLLLLLPSFTFVAAHVNESLWASAIYLVTTIGLLLILKAVDFRATCRWRPRDDRL